MTADDDVLALLARDGEATWGKDFYKKKGPPIQPLKRLAAKGFAEVETRTCSPWNFGPLAPPWRLTSQQSAADQKAAYEANKKWHDENPRTLNGRSEVYARVTPRGIEEAHRLGLLD